MIFACVMAMLGLEIIVESCRKLTSNVFTLFNKHDFYNVIIF